MAVLAPPEIAPARQVLKNMILDLLEADSGDDLSTLKAMVDADLMTDAAVDSLRMVNIVFEIETRLGIHIDDHELTSSRLRSLDRFTEFLETKLADQNRAGSRTGSKP